MAKNGNHAPHSVCVMFSTPFEDEFKKMDRPVRTVNFTSYENGRFVAPFVYITKPWTTDRDMIPSYRSTMNYIDARAKELGYNPWTVTTIVSGETGIRTFSGDWSRNFAMGFFADDEMLTEERGEANDQ